MHVYLYLMFHWDFDSKTNTRIEARLRMAVSKEIHIEQSHNFKEPQRIKDLWKMNKMSLDDEKMESYVKKQFYKFGMDTKEHTFKVPGSLRGKKGEETGKNIYSILEGKRVYGKDCFLVTYNYSNFIKLIQRKQH